MLKREPRYPIDEIARRGKELYETKIRPIVETGNIGRIVSIDIETGDYVLADDFLTATQELINKIPDAQIWTLRIGHVAVDKFGGGDTREKR